MRRGIWDFLAPFATVWLNLGLAICRMRSSSIIFAPCFERFQDKSNTITSFAPLEKSMFYPIWLSHCSSCTCARKGISSKLKNTGLEQMIVNHAKFIPQPTKRCLASAKYAPSTFLTSSVGKTSAVPFDAILNGLHDWRSSIPVCIPTTMSTCINAWCVTTYMSSITVNLFAFRRSLGVISRMGDLGAGVFKMCKI